MTANLCDTAELSGARFSNAYSCRYGRGPDDHRDRFSLLTRLATGQRVIHLGFADHVPLIDRKRRDGVWMHDHLARVADHLVGLDSNAEAVAHAQSLGVRNVYHFCLGNMSIPSAMSTTQFDVLVVPEVLEHTPSPLDFLSLLRSTFRHCCGSLLLTVPNAFSVMATINAFRGLERINSDHRFAFTPYTLQKIAWESGVRITDFHFVDGYPKTGLRRLKNIVTQTFCMTRDQLVLLGTWRD